MVSGVLLVMTLADRLVQSALLLNQAGFGLVLLQFVTTILAYPLIVLLSHLLFGVKRMAPGEIDKTGHRI